jgi:hypothetical protein
VSISALLDQDDRASQYRDEFACAGLQPETIDEDSGNSWIDAGVGGLRAFLSSSIIDADKIQKIE